MLASDDANPDFVGARNPDSALAVEFYTRPVQNMFESSKQGRPVYEDVIYIRINVPGQKDMQVDTPARTDHQQRFPLQWAHYKNKTEGDAREIGTPLAEWPVLTRSQAEEFRAIKFFTVESIANASDANIGNLGMVGGMSPYALREKAKAFLEAATNSALPQHQAEELAKRDAEITALKEEMKRLAETVKAQMQSPGVPPAQPVIEPVLPKRRPGRPTNAEIAARKAAEAKAA